MAQQIILRITHPSNIAIRSQEHGRRIQLFADIRHVRNPVAPASHRKRAGLVEQETAAVVREVEHTPARETDVTQPSAEQLWPVAEVVANPDAADLFREVLADSLEPHQLGEHAANGLWAGLRRR